ncbi:ASCH domain-containing protein [Enterococcus sp. LJL99]
MKNTEIEVLKFSGITEQHAVTEGEGDKSLEYWRDVHIAFFTSSYQENKEVKFDEDSLVVFETFKVIYRGAE